MTVLDTVRAWFIAPPDASPELHGSASPSQSRKRRPHPSPHVPVASVPTSPSLASPLPSQVPPPSQRPPSPPISPQTPSVATPAVAPLASTFAATAASSAAFAITSAAVLGRPGDAEPVAAALALALRRTTRSKAATVAVLGSAPTAAESGGSAAARRVTERLRAHGFGAHARGCLVWTHVDPASDRVIALAQRVTVVAAPAVFAVTASRTHDVDEIVSEQDLVVLVASDPQGPLAHLAAHGLGPDAPVVVVRPLRRGVGRALAWAGIRPARPITRLLGPQIDTGGGRA